MSESLLTTTLGDLVTARPDSARILERRGLDYCCGGREQLGDACSRLGIAVKEVVAELAEVTESPADWSSMPPAELVDHLESTHHAYLHSELGRLDALATKVAGVHGERHPELAAILETTQAIRADLEPHLAKEERVLFPMIRELATATEAPSFHCGSLRNPISMMMLEHDRAGDLLARLRELTDNYTPPADGCASYQALFAGLAELEADTHLHVHKENNVLFPAVVALEAGFDAREASPA